MKLLVIQVLLLIVFQYLFTWEPMKSVLKKTSRVFAIIGLYIEFAVDCLMVYLDKVLQPLIVYSITMSNPNLIVCKKEIPGPYIIGSTKVRERTIYTKVYSRDRGVFASRTISKVTEPMVEDEVPLRSEEILEVIAIKPFWHDWTWQGTAERLRATKIVMKTSSRKRRPKTRSFYNSIKTSS